MEELRKAVLDKADSLSYVDPRVKDDPLMQAAIADFVYELHKED